MEDQKGYLNLDLVNVMYGVVAGYGFFFIDKATTISDYMMFVFAYAILCMDWIYSHRTYRGQEYRKSYLILDLAALFLFSRILSSSTVDRPNFFVWLGLLYVLYVIWDFIMRGDNIRSGYSWASCIGSDLAGAVIFFVTGLALRSQLWLYDSVLIPIAAIVIYFILTIAWFKKTTPIST